MVLHADEVKGSRTKGPNTSGSIVTTGHTWHSHASQLFTHLNIFNGLFFFPFENRPLRHMTLGPWVIRATAQLCNKLIIAQNHALTKKEPPSMPRLLLSLQ